MDKKICLIAAVSKNGVYGQGGKIPWRIPEEQRFFKEKTMGHAVVMGRKTWESLSIKLRPLPMRENIVITSDLDFQASGARVSASLRDSIHTAESRTVFVIGGRTLWFETMEIVDEAWVTVVHADYPIDNLTATAPALVHPARYWPGVVPHEIDRYPSVGDAPAFDIHHWVRM